MNLETNPKFKPFRSGRIVSIAVLIIAVVVIGMNSFTSVEYGHVGLYKTFGKLNNNMLSPGLHFKIPFIQQVIDLYKTERKKAPRRKGRGAVVPPLFRVNPYAAEQENYNPCVPARVDSVFHPLTLEAGPPYPCCDDTRALQGPTRK